jgi:S-formylglutathione hydrolase
MKIISQNRCFDGVQGVYEHESAALGCTMKFAAFAPPQAETGKVPVVWWLSGLTCTHVNFTEKAGAQRVAAELGVMVVAPDTSPRGPDVPDDPDGAYDFGLGAGFYVDATEEPWAKNYQMRTYIEDELPILVAEHLPGDLTRQSIMGHSMGGHGALTIALRSPFRYAAVSAFAPIVSPMNCPWGVKALGRYLGEDRNAWRAYDACALIEDGARVEALLVEQGTADQFLTEQLKPELLEAACETAGIPLTLNRRAHYDHSYYFMASFIEDHLRWHAEKLGV